MPTLLIISGHPCAGKSTIARSVAARLGWPLLQKDAVKEVLFERLGVGDRPWSQRLGGAAFEILWAMAEAVLAAGQSVIVEGPVPPAASASLARVSEATGARVVVVVVTAPPTVIVERAGRRAAGDDPSRHAGHLDAELLDQLRLDAQKPYQSVRLPGVEPVDVDGLAADAVDRICALAQPPPEPS